ncbi:hypothetical protein Aple_084010 [Acrocarpospora pleiomorpha]|uniref:Uncharacterized protein n=1 Tax=Acrocarpospora pleiomorpha TaxID=90975 RepID=A0A5M3XWZ4_9ACTN|nr:hypothetical protein Aple_084010 [Acrocarpospora pleiomorpha]
MTFRPDAGVLVTARSIGPKQIIKVEDSGFCPARSRITVEGWALTVSVRRE